MNRPALHLRFVATVLGACGHAAAQCDPTWDTTLGLPGIGGGYVEPMVAWNDGTGEKLYVGGSATDIGGNTLIDFLGVYNPATGQWSRPGAGIQQGTTNAFLTKLLPWNDGNGEKLYVVGQFSGAGNVAGTNSFARWTGSAWESCGAGFTQAVVRVTYDLLPADIDGQGVKLLVAGNFASIGGVPGTASLARFDGTSFSTWGPGGNLTGFSPFVARLFEWDDGSGRAIYACGRFGSIGGVSATNVARYRVSTGQWEPFGQALIPTSSTNNMTSWAVFDDGSGAALYVGGQQFRIGGLGQVYNVAKWNGSTWTGVAGPGQVISGRTTGLAVFNDGNGPALYQCGTATFEVNYFAKLAGGSWQSVLGGGVNNPPVEGNFCSAFGLYAWNDRLLVGGNFTQVGGMDPTTGIGVGDPVPARGIAAVLACDGACPADWNGDDSVNSNDISAFLTAWLDSVQNGNLVADFDGNNAVNSSDISAFLTAWLQAVQSGC